MASGEDMLPPSSTETQTLGESHEDVYQPTMDLKEGSGDNEKELAVVSKARVTNEFEGVTLRTNSSNIPPSGSRSYGKRKRGKGSDRNKKQKISASQIADAFTVVATAFENTTEAIKILTASGARVTNEFEGVTLRANNPNIAPGGPSGSGSHGKRKRGKGSDGNKKQKIPVSQKIVDGISRIATASEIAAEAVKKMKDNLDWVRQTPATELVAELLSIEEIAGDRGLCVRCCNLLAYKPFREIFSALRDDRQILVGWLRYSAYNPPPYVKWPHL